MFVIEVALKFNTCNNAAINLSIYDVYFYWNVYLEHLRNCLGDGIEPVQLVKLLKD